MADRPHGRWLICRTRRSDARVRLYCFPHAGGSPGEYLRWADRLAEMEIWAVQPPGRGVRYAEPAHRDVDSLVADLVAAARFEPPFALFGHSYGALVAYLVARALRATGREGPRHLFLSGHRAAHLALRRAPLHRLDDADLLAAIGRRNGALPPEILEDPEYLREVLAGYRADLEAAETYRHRPEPPLSVPITVTAGADDDGARDELEAWRPHTTGEFTLRLFPGDHFYLRPYRADLLRLIEERLSLSPPAQVG